MRGKASVCIALFAAFAMVAGSGCATLFSSDTCVVQFESTPPGATYTYGPFSGKTPDSVAVPKKAIASYASFAMNGYQSKTVPVTTGITGVFWLNLLFWPGLIIDVVTGDYQTIKQPTVTAMLDPQAPGSVGSAAPAGTVPAPKADAPAQALKTAPQG